MKSIIFFSLLVAAIAIPLAEAQIVLPLPQLITINGAVFCSVNVSVPGTTLTPFPNATVQLQCGRTVFSTATTTANGTFLIVLNNNITTGLITSILIGGCRVVVITPLATCNVTLGSQTGIQAAFLQLLSPLSGLSSIPALPGLPGTPAIPSLPALPITFPIVLKLTTSVFAVFSNLPI